MELVLLVSILGKNLQHGRAVEAGGIKRVIGQQSIKNGEKKFLKETVIHAKNVDSADMSNLIILKGLLTSQNLDTK